MKVLWGRLRAAGTVLVLVCTAVGGVTGLAQAATGLKALSWSDSSVDATAGTAANTLTFTINDDAPDGWVEVALEGPGGTPFEPPYRISYRAGSAEGRYVAGEVSRADGWVTFRYTFRVPKFAHREDAVWRVTAVGDAYLPAHFDYDFTAGSLVDSTAPTYSSLTSQKDVWFGGAESTTNFYWLDLADSGTGVFQAGITLTGPGGDTLSATSKPPTSMPYPPSTSLDVSAAIVATFPADKQTGTWTVSEVWLVDVVGNRATYPGLSLAPVTFTDNSVVTITGLAATPAEVENWHEPQTSTLSATVTAPAPISTAEVVVDEPCVAGTPTPPTGTTGTLSVPVTVPVSATTCVIRGLAVRDQAGNVSLLGSRYGGPALPTLTRKTGPAPEIRDITVGIDSVDWNERTDFQVTVDMRSWGPGVTHATLWVKGSDVDFPHYRDVANVRDGQVTFQVYASVTRLWTDELTVHVRLTDAAGLSTYERDDQAIPVRRPAGLSGFSPTAPTRLLDTRTSGVLGPGATLTLDTEVPYNASAVVLNVTAVAPTAGSYLTVWPDGTQRPNSSNLNFVAGQTVANLVTVRVSPDGKVRIRNNAGDVHVIVDIFGFYDSDGGLRFHPRLPTRILDTRQTGGPMGHATERLVDTGLRYPNGASAVVLNVTAAGTTRAGYLTVWQDGEPRPATSNVNFPAGWTGANQVIVPVSQYEGKIRIYNHGGDTNVLVDLAGHFSQEVPGSSYLVPTDPTRVLDTRGGGTALGPGAVRELAIPGLPTKADAVVLNVTATAPTASSYLTVWPDGAARPPVSSLNFTRAKTVPNMVTVPVHDGKIQIYNHAGTTHVVVDLAGYYLRAYR